MAEKHPIVGRQGRLHKGVPPLNPTRRRTVEVVSSTGEVVGTVDSEELHGMLLTTRAPLNKPPLSRPSFRLTPSRVEADKQPKSKSVGIRVRTHLTYVTVRNKGIENSTLPPRGLRGPVEDFEHEAKRLGVALGKAANEEEALARLKRVAADASDVFSTPEKALRFLTSTPLDSKGRNGIQILQQSGLPGVISKLDQMRFGYSG